jgi:hypothetical protein
MRVDWYQVLDCTEFFIGSVKLDSSVAHFVTPTSVIRAVGEKRTRTDLGSRPAAVFKSAGLTIDLEIG